MKLIYYILPLAVVGLIIYGFTQFNNDTQQSISAVNVHKTGKPFAEKISERKILGDFRKISVFSVSNQPDGNALKTFTRKATFLKLDKAKLQSLVSAKENDISLSIPNGEIVWELELTKVNFLSQNMKLAALNSDGTINSVEDFKPGVYYQGIIKGDAHSMAAVSFFENEVIGIISNDNGNFNLGTIKDASNKNTDNYIFYNDRDLLVANPFLCGINDKNENKLNAGSRRDWNKIKQVAQEQGDIPNGPIKVKFVCDYDMYQRFGAGLPNYVSGFFNAVNQIYGGESVQIALADTLAYFTSQDPYYPLYQNLDSYPVLLRFAGNTRDGFGGDIAHLLSTWTYQGQAVLGGIANINVLCQSFNPTDSSGRFCFSNIEDTYQGYPTFSWTVEVTTHEMGHVIASRHTHACVWPVYGSGSNVPIDTCVLTAENSIYGGFQEACVNYPMVQGCFNEYGPSGTIMSYCHFCQNRGINFVNGFGSLPGDTIRLGYGLANCIGRTINSSENPVTFDVLQNYPNPFNPSTQITFAIPKASNASLVVYDILGREVTRIIDNNFYQPGFYNVSFNTSDYQLASGVYFYRLIANADGKVVYSQIKKMVLVK